MQHLVRPDRVHTRHGADVVVFDLDTISDKATFTEPAHLPVGFRRVIVNGTPIIEDGSLSRRCPARPSRS